MYSSFINCSERNVLFFQIAIIVMSFCFFFQLFQHLQRIQKGHAELLFKKKQIYRQTDKTNIVTI